MLFYQGYEIMVGSSDLSAGGQICIDHHCPLQLSTPCPLLAHDLSTLWVGLRYYIREYLVQMETVLNWGPY